jgi:putative membrane protein
MNIWRDVVAGVVGGAVAAGSMSLVHGIVATKGAGAPPQPALPGQPRQEDATVKVAEGIVGRLVHRPLPEAARPLAGNLVHYAFGASVGALYGGVAAVAPRVTAGVGLPFGAAVWLGAHVIATPALGLAEPPSSRPRKEEGLELVTHLVYGMVTELTRRLARRALSPSAIIEPSQRRTP